MASKSELEAALMMLNDQITEIRASVETDRTVELHDLLGAKDEILMALINLRNSKMRAA